MRVLNRRNMTRSSLNLFMSLYCFKTWWDFKYDILKNIPLYVYWPEHQRCHYRRKNFCRTCALSRLYHEPLHWFDQWVQLALPQVWHPSSMSSRVRDMLILQNLVHETPPSCPPRMLPEAKKKRWTVSVATHIPIVMEFILYKYCIVTCPEYKWQNPLMIFSLYKLPAAVSIRRIYCICL